MRCASHHPRESGFIRDLTLELRRRRRHLPHGRVLKSVVQAEVARVAGERDELEGRADDAEGGLAAAQAEMETVQKRLEAELAQLRHDSRREREEAGLAHDAEVCILACPYP